MNGARDRDETGIADEERGLDPREAASLHTGALGELDGLEGSRQRSDLSDYSLPDTGVRSQPPRLRPELSLGCRR